VLLAIGAIGTVGWAPSQPEHEKKPIESSTLELIVGTNKLKYVIPEGRTVKIALDKDGKLDFQTIGVGTSPPGTNAPAK
jgi:hypothetical protein